MFKTRLQMFAVPDNITGKAQIQVQAREIDFVSSFSRSIQSLLEIMGITKMIEKENGSILYTKTVTGVLQSGSVAEGDEVPYSRYNVVKTPVDSIAIEKYRKGVTAEAIAEKGYAAAVADTDEEFKIDLQNKVLDRFYAALREGTLTGSYSTFQMAFAMAIGSAINKFKAMRKQATGIACFVNTLDFYQYLGGAELTLQTAFGMQYLTNFMGADVVFISSEIERNKIYATPLNNLVCYYVNPGNSEFAQAGLSYTTDAETGFIGFHTEGNYGRVLSEAFALMGLRLFAEYLDGIAKVTVNTLSLVEAVATGSDILGKAASDLMDGVVIANGFATGKLKYVTGYTGFSGDPAQQSGNYLAFVSTADASCDKITVELFNSTTKVGEQTLDSDGIAVFRIVDKDKQKAIIRAYKGEVVQTEVIDLSKLTVATA